MANKEDLRIAKVLQELKIVNNAITQAIDNGATLAARLVDAQDGDNTSVWSQTLYGTAQTGTATLTIDSVAKTISCLAGANLFSSFRVGRDVQLKSFSDAANNQTTEITAVTDDMITVVSSTLVDETDTAAKAREAATTDEKAIVDALILNTDRLTEIQAALDNGVVVTADRRGDLTDFSW